MVRRNSGCKGWKTLTSGQFGLNLYARQVWANLCTMAGKNAGIAAAQNAASGEYIPANIRIAMP